MPMAMTAKIMSAATTSTMPMPDSSRAGELRSRRMDTRISLRELRGMTG